jgi:hypothetical protein
MTESFLILLAAGVMLAAGISNPKEVTINWLRLAGIIALAMAALSLYFFYPINKPQKLNVPYAILTASIFVYLTIIHLPMPNSARPVAFAAFGAATVLAARHLLATPTPLSYLTTAGVSAMCGLALMDMLLGHAYLTASKMTIRPFVRLHLSLAVVTVLRALCAVGLTMLFLSRHPVELFWDRFGILVLTRWLVGLLVPAVFIYMAWDCIRRRSTQSATGILYVAGVLIFIGELIALYLLRETRLPF